MADTPGTGGIAFAGGLTYDATNDILLTNKFRLSMHSKVNDQLSFDGRLAAELLEVLAHLLLGEASAFGAGFAPVLSALLDLPAGHLAIVDVLAVGVELGVALRESPGDARQLATEHAQLALELAAGNGPVEPPCVVLSGGETTVRVTGDGRGGRNGEYALALAVALDGHPRISALACDTDGIDGSGDNAGCMVFPDSLQRFSGDVRRIQQKNDSYAFFADVGDLIITGPTRTNVNDFRAILVR